MGAMRAQGRLLDGLRLVLAVVVVAGVAVAVAGNWAAVSGELARVTPGTLVGAAATAALAPVLTMLGWRVVLADLGSPLHAAPAGGVFFVGQLGKYLPGSVWSVVAQTEMGARLHIPRRRSAVAALTTVGMAAVTGFVAGLPAVPVLLRQEEAADLGWWLAVTVPLLALAFWPPLLNRGIALALRLLRRAPLEHDLSARAVLAAGGLFVGAWLCAGLHVLVLASAVAPERAGSLPLAVAAVSGFCLASALGMLAVVLPAGVGVREGLLVLLLGTLMPTASAVAVVVVSRFVTMVLDVLFAVGGWAYARSHHLLSASSAGSAP